LEIAYKLALISGTHHKPPDAHHTVTRTTHTHTCLYGLLCGVRLGVYVNNF